MKTEEDEAFEDIERRQGGFQAKRAMAADKTQEPVSHLWESLGRWSAYLVQNGKQADCAPPAWLVDAIKNATTPSQPAQEQCQKHGECFGGECIYPPAQEPVREALKLALDALEAVNPSLVCDMAHHSKKYQHGIGQTCPLEIRHLETITAIKEALAQPAQKPVTTVTSESGNPDVTMSWWHEPPLPVGTPLYTYPPQREWVGLTPEDILDLFDEQNLYGSKLVEFTRAVEAKIKDKNNG